MGKTKKDRNDTEVLLTKSERVKRALGKESKRLRTKLQVIQHDSRNPSEIIEDTKEQFEDWL
jgi:hypothetical protein